MNVVLKVVVAGIVDVPEIVKAVKDMDLDSAITLEIEVMRGHFPPPSIAPEDQAALDAALKQTEDALAQATALKTDPSAGA
jgi:sugar phosphate isomerase/epimerase